MLKQLTDCKAIALDKSEISVKDKVPKVTRKPCLTAATVRVPYIPRTSLWERDVLQTKGRMPMVEVRVGYLP